jgi:hypothetical protein
MMTYQEFINKAIELGYNPSNLTKDQMQFAYAFGYCGFGFDVKKSLEFAIN